jgi:STE24 endopeptidase
VVVVFLAVDFVIEMPWNIYANWWREAAYGLTSQSLGGWFGEQLIGLVISLIMTVVFMEALYALMRRARRWWWAWAGAVTAVGFLFLLAVEPVAIEPLFNKYTPAPEGPTRAAVVALATRAGAPSDKIYIYDGSKQSNRYTANVSGLGGTARIAMSDVMFAKGADLAEVRAVVGHEMGHYKHGHVYWLVLVFSVLAVALLWIADRVFPWAARLMGSPAEVISDPVGLPVIMALVAVLGLFATPVVNTMTRLDESDADAFSLSLANEPDGLSKALVKTSEYRAPSPSALEEWLFYDHPSVGRRVRRAMDWKASHPPG